MSVASRIESISNHLENAYNKLEDLGINLENVNKNLENLSINLDSAYEEWPKKVEEGTEINLTNIRNGKMNLTLKGNLSQDTLEGKNLFNKNTITLKRYFYQDGSLSYASTNFCISAYIQINANTTYTYQGLTAVGDDPYSIYYDSNKQMISSFKQQPGINNILTPENAAYVRFSIKNSNGDENTFMIEEGSVASPYEPFCDGIPSPSPSYPQEIQTVTGNNIITITGKNLFDENLTRGSIGQGSSIRLRSTNQIKVESETNYTLNLSSTSKIQAIIYEYDSSDNRTQLTQSWNYLPYTFQTSSTTAKIRFVLRKDNDDTLLIEDVSKVQLEKGSTNTKYAPYILYNCPINLIGKNMFNKESYWDNYRLDVSGDNYYQSGYYISHFIEVKPNTTYIKNSPVEDGYHRVAFYITKNKESFISYANDNLFTTPSNCHVVRFCGLKTELNTTQLEKGNQSTTYENYYEPIDLYKNGNHEDYIYNQNNKWYKYKEVEHILITGYEESWKMDNKETLCGVTIPNGLIETSTTAVSDIYCNRFSATTFLNTRKDAYINSFSLYGSNGGMYLWFNKRGKTLEDFKTWFTTLEYTIAYYPLENPVIIEITNPTLISQLEYLKSRKSSEDKTDISQTNENKPFIITASALLKSSE